MSQPLDPIFASHRKFLEFAKGGRPYVVVELDEMLEPTPIAGYSDRTVAIDASYARQNTRHTPHVVYYLRQAEFGWQCDYQDIG